jgi:deoxyribonuclease V
MKIKYLHPWDVTYPEAIKIQDRLCLEIVQKKIPGTIKYVAGADVSCSRRSHTLWAGLVILSYPALKKEEEKWIKGKAVFPYIPGLLSFREVPLLLEVIEKLGIEPDLIFCDGQGIAHPRGMGLASHLGLFTKKPTIGCAKTRLVGEFSEVGKDRGDYSELWYKGLKVGAVVRTRRGVRPLFVSPGYAITIDESIKMVLNCGGHYRVPEPTRQAHILVNRLRGQEEAL